MFRTFEIPPGDWGDYLALVSGSLGLAGACLWLEEADGRRAPIARSLPFAGASLETHGHGTPAIEIQLVGAIAHRIPFPTRLWLGVTEDGLLDGLLIEDRDERRTLLRFESSARIPLIH